ncbi:MAG: Gfo/Idh/MocA family oxidoreductase [Verrucomicrobiales bacterium]|nr:Gfo/Idh/MocA family oxidoreductase [Verrucomicrobiales bacterium]
MKSIYARTAQRNPVIKGEDSALIICEMENGITTVLDANRYNECEAGDPRYTFGKYRIEGSKGHLEMNEEGNMSLKLLGEPSREHGYRHEKCQFAGDCVNALQQHSVTSVQNTPPFESTPEDYFNGVLLVEQACESAAENRVVTVDNLTTGVLPGT